MTLRWFVPGRIEILGKHTDYAGGRSLVCATSRGIAVTAAPRADAVLKITDLRRGLAAQFEIDAGLDVATGDWTTFPRTVARRLARNFPGGLRGADVTIDSNLPRAAGLSSSSAMVVSFFAVLAAVNVLEERPEYRDNVATREDLAEYLGCCENGRTYRGLAGDLGVGTFGGSQDHTAIVCCRAGLIEQYGFAPVRHERSIALDAGWTFAIGVSGVSADKTGDARDAYNRASQSASAVLQAWNAATGRDDPTLFVAATSSPDARERIARVVGRIRRFGAQPAAHQSDHRLGARPAADHRHFDAPELQGRFQQFAAEALDLVPAAGDALSRGDMDQFGTLVDRSQHNAEQWLGNQVPETIALARLARESGAAAASAFGAGFGGSVWALVPAGEAEEFVTQWSAAYRGAFPQRAARSGFFKTRPADGWT